MAWVKCSADRADFFVVAIEIIEGLDEEFDGWLASQTDVEVPPADSPEPTLRSKLRARVRSGRPRPEPEPPPAPAQPPAFDSYGQETAPVRVASRSDSGRRLDAHLLTILTAAVALPALRLPVAWLAVCASTAIVLVAVDSVRGHATKKGSADVVVVPARAAGHLLLGCVNPLNWLKVLLGALAALTAGALAGGVIAAARWMAIEGPDGILAATRIGVWAHAPTYGAVFACYLLLSGVGRAHERRAVALYGFTRTLPEVVLAGFTVVLVTATVTLALAGPQVDIGFVRSSDGLGWVPPGLRTLADKLRDDAVDAELDGVTQCLSGAQSRLWTYGYTSGTHSPSPTSRG